MTRLVQLSVNTPSPSSDLKVRVYYPVTLLTGPDLQVCRTYDEYLLYYGEDSFAQLLFNWDYELLCHRVSYVHSKANLTKYYLEELPKDKYQYYQDTGDYLQSPILIQPRTSKSTHRNSFLITINQSASNYNDFYFIIRTRVKAKSAGLIYNYSMGLFGCDYITQSDTRSYDEGKTDISNRFDLEPISRSKFLKPVQITPSGSVDLHLNLETFELTLKEFLINCGLLVESLGYHRILVSSASEDTSYSIYSDVVSVEELEDYYDRYYASIYKDHRILSISSKYDSAYSNIKVNVERLDSGSYSIHVSKTSGDWIGEEYFIVDRYLEGNSEGNVRTFEEINLRSNIIQLKTFGDLESESWDPSGIYELKGTYGFNDKALMMNDLSILTDKVIDGYYTGSVFYQDKNYETLIIPTINDVYEDLNELKYYVWDGIEYLEVDYIEYEVPQVDVVMDFSNDNQITNQLNKVFPQALILTSPGFPVNNGIRINPGIVYWYNLREEIPSGFAIINLLLTTSYYNDLTEFRLSINRPLYESDQYDLEIKEIDYGVEVNSVYVNRFGSNLKYSIRSFLARAMFYRVCMDISEITVSGIHDYIEDQCSQIATKLNLNVTYELRNENQVGRSYKADLFILVDNRLFTRFEIYTELNYEA